MPPCQGDKKILKKVRGEGSVGGGMPGRGGARTKSSLPPRGADGVNRHAERTPRPALDPCGPIGATQQDSRWGATSSQTVASEQTKTSILGEKSAFLLISLQHEARQSGRAQTTSVIDAINRRALLVGGLPVLILTIPNNPFLHPCALSGYNCGCNPDSRKSVRTRFFHRIRNLAGPMETPLCKISF
jgi:hypothetical protein